MDNYNYPMGADTPDAPWNQKAPNMVKCEACNGKGKHWHAYDITMNREKECTETAWDILPETEEEAERRGEHYMRGEVEICEVCDGEGKVEYEEEDYGPDPDDYYESLRERRFEDE